jgi:hypothetical protein
VARRTVFLLADTVSAAERVVHRRTLPAPGGGRWIEGKSRTAMLDLLRRHGLDAFVAAALRVPLGHDDRPADHVPRFLSQVGTILDAPADGAATAPEVDERAAKLEQRITALRNQYDVYSRSGVDEDDDLMAVIREQVAECENDLEQLRAEGAA